MVINNKVFIRNLEVQQPPLSRAGGRITSPAGEIAQIANGMEIKYIGYLEFKNDSSLRRGNHYHLNKEEFLYIISGKLRAIYKDIETGVAQDVIVRTGDLINIKSGCAHVYIPLEYSQAIEFSASEYDIADTHKYLIE